MAAPILSTMSAQELARLLISEVSPGNFQLKAVTGSVSQTEFDLISAAADKTTNFVYTDEGGPAERLEIIEVNSPTVVSTKKAVSTFSYHSGISTDPGYLTVTAIAQSVAVI